MDFADIRCFFFLQILNSVALQPDALAEISRQLVFVRRRFHGGFWCSQAERTEFLVGVLLGEQPRVVRPEVHR